MVSASYLSVLLECIYLGGIFALHFLKAIGCEWKAYHVETTFYNSFSSPQILECEFYLLELMVSGAPIGPFCSLYYVKGCYRTVGEVIDWMTARGDVGSG